MLRNLMLSGVSSLPLFAPDGGAGSGGGDGGGAGGTRSAGEGAAGGSNGAGAGAGAGAGGAGSAAGAGASAGADAGAGGAAGGTLAGGASGGAAAAAGAAVLKPDLPADWDFRGYLANGDAAVAKDLAKYTDPRAIYNALRDVQTKISKGELKAAPAPLPANATDEQKTAWRAAQGLPATPDDYVKAIALPNGVVLGEADKPFIESFAKAMFDQGGTPAELNRAVSWWYQAQDAAAAQRIEADGEFRTTSEVSLRQEWGPEFGNNMNAFGTFKALLPEDLQTLLFTARTADGQVVGNHPAFIKIGAALGREINPVASLMPSNTGTTVDVGAELGRLEAMMGDQRSEYWRGPNAESNQKRYRELVDARDKMATRGRAA